MVVMEETVEIIMLVLIFASAALVPMAMLLYPEDGE